MLTKGHNALSVGSWIFLPFLQIWSSGAATGSQYDDLGACLEAARHKELPMDLERDLMMLHTIKPHYDLVKKGWWSGLKASQHGNLGTSVSTRCCLYQHACHVCLQRPRVCGYLQHCTSCHCVQS